MLFNVQELNDSSGNYYGINQISKNINAATVASGMGLIKCGSVVIPFDNQISKDTDLYKLYNTNIHEKIVRQRKRNYWQKVIERLPLSWYN